MELVDKPDSNLSDELQLYYSSYLGKAGHCQKMDYINARNMVKMLMEGFTNKRAEKVDVKFFPLDMEKIQILKEVRREEICKYIL